MCMKWVPWIPLLAILVVVPAVYLHADAHPLPANGYGHEMYHTHENLFVPSESSQTVSIGGDVGIPADSLIRFEVFVLTERPNSDLSEHASFQLAYAGSVVTEDDGAGLTRTFYSTQDTIPAENPQILIRNENDFPIEVGYHAFVIRPPTTREHFLLYAPGLLLAGLLVAIWPVFSLTHQRPSGDAS